MPHVQRFPAIFWGRARIFGSFAFMRLSPASLPQWFFAKK
jgi:hypothetical protein